MNTFWFLTTSNKPRLRDPTQVKRIIERYWFDFDCEVTIERAPGGRSHLCIEGDGWPAAWPLPPDIIPEDYYPDFATDGQDEFAAFLAEISPFLKETLVVQAIGNVGGRFPLSACEWRVEAGCPEIATTGFTSHAEDSAVHALASV